MDFKNETEIIQFINTIVPALSTGVGIGDDAAVIGVAGKKIVTTTDSLVENVHFKSEWVTPIYLGKKAAISNLSDIAAMGAQPLHALVSLILPEKYRSTLFIRKLYRGFQYEFYKTKTSIIGGNITSGKELCITLTIIGEVQKPLLRSTASVGDILCCTECVGNAACEVELLQKGKKKKMEYLSNQHILFAQNAAKENVMTACIDISDGLALDLHRMCVASKVGVIVDSLRIPRIQKVSTEHALYGGEDYELLFTVSPKNINKVLKLSQKTNTQITQIGEIKSKIFGMKIFSNGHQKQLFPKGWDHVSM